MFNSPDRVSGRVVHGGYAGRGALCIHHGTMAKIQRS